MAIHLTPEQRELGKANFHRTVGELALESRNDKGPTRRQFMKGLIAAGITAPIGAAAYFGYSQAREVIGKNPVKAALIGAGNQGNALVHHHNPQYLQFVAVHDIRPTNQKRIFTGFGSTKGFNAIYGGGAKDIKVYTDMEGYKEILARKDIEAVVIALPLHLHAPVAIECMKAGKHVLCEKLMARTVGQCKEMIKVARATDRCLAIGHQRHYSMMYAHAVEVLQSGVLGDVRCIRANWHRNNTWPQVDPRTGKPTGNLRDSWKPKIDDKDKDAPFKEFGYNSLEELVRWRLFNRTGAGLMAELGSHQLDACSIFLGKVHPLAVSGVGGKFFYKDDREIDDHIFVNFEFPGPNYSKDRNDIVVVTYSSINTNQFEPYGECVMGTRGTMIVEGEREIMLFAERDPNKTRPKGSARSTSVTVARTGAGEAVIDSAATEPGGVAEQIGEKSMGAPPPSRGYKEEMEHFAYCIRLWDESPKIRPWDKSPGKEQDEERKRRLPRCHGQVAMADAVIALTANVAMKTRQRIEFRPEWFDFESDQVPETLLPKDDKLA